MGRWRHILPVAFFCLFLSACGGQKGRVIPEKKMAALYVDMFLADQWLKENKQARPVADTTLFFDPIFEKHGYTFADYERSMEYYSSETEVLSKILDSASVMLKRQAEGFTRLSSRINKAKEENEKNRVDYVVVDFSRDSTLWAAVGVLWPAKDSLAVQRDSARAGTFVLSRPKIDGPTIGRPMKVRREDVQSRIEMKEIELRK